MLSEKQKENIKNWKYSVEDHSITTILFSWMWDFFVQFVPHYVAPNVLSLSGLICILYAAFINYHYLDAYPTIIRLSCVLLIQMYQILDSIDGKHARATHNSSPLGELFDHACDNVGVVFITLIVIRCLGITDVHLIYYFIQGSQIVFLASHIEAFKTGVVYFPMLAGPGEFLLLAQIAILFRFPNGILSIIEKSILPAYFIVLISTLYQIWFLLKEKVEDGNLNKNDKSDTYIGTKLGLTFCLGMRSISMIMVYSGAFDDITVVDCICHGLILSVVCSDMIVAKMAKRNIHPWVVVACMVGMFHQNIIILLTVAGYYYVMFKSLADALNIRIFTPNVNVYVCGVYDMLHAGHMKSFMSALEFGDRLIVGVHNDKDVQSYKRVPYMKMDLRVDAATECKGVWKIIPNAPLKTSRQFMIDNHIDVIAISEEYKDALDKWFDDDVVPFVKFTRRTEGISTTDIVKTVIERNSDIKK